MKTALMIGAVALSAAFGISPNSAHADATCRVTKVGTSTGFSAEDAVSIRCASGQSFRFYTHRDQADQATAAARLERFLNAALKAWELHADLFVVTQIGGDTTRITAWELQLAP